MKKTIGILVAVMLCMIGSVFAAPSFSVDHNVVVTGDWKYDGGWTQGEFATAVYDVSAVSMNSHAVMPFTTPEPFNCAFDPVTTSQS